MITKDARRELQTSWRIIAACILGTMFANLLVYSTSVFLNPWSSSLGWSLSQISAYTLFMSAGILISAPLNGILMDRFGARRLILVFIPIWALAIASAAFVGPQLWSLYLITVVWGLVLTMSNAYSRAINARFEAARGAALGLMSIGYGLSATFGPRITQSIVDTHGWRAGFLGLAALSLLAFPGAFFWLHERPFRREPGPEQVEGAQLEPAKNVGLTRSEAVRSPVFWLLGAAFMLWSLTQGGSTVLLMPALTEYGFSRSLAATAIGVQGVTTLIAQPLIGFAVDRLRAPLLSSIIFLLLASAFVLLGVFGAKFAFVAMGLIGFATGSESNVFGYCVARYFGMRAYGQIYGLMIPIPAIGYALGAPMFSLTRDWSGNYSLPYLCVAALALGSAVLMLGLSRIPFLDEKRLAGVPGDNGWSSASAPQPNA